MLLMPQGGVGDIKRRCMVLDGQTIRRILRVGAGKC